RYLEHLAMRAVQRRDIERIVQFLDAEVAHGAMAPASAKKIWGTVTKMFRDACRSKLLALRVREDNPCDNVQGPDHGPGKEGPYLYPSELLAVASCAAIPVERRVRIVLAVYTGLRRGELAALRWEDVDLEAGTLFVHRSRDFDTGETSTTKTGRARRVPIEPTLRPLLEAMQGDDDQAVIEIPVGGGFAEVLRSDLVRAGCDRAALTANDATRRPLSFHDLRHTYGT